MICYPGVKAQFPARQFPFDTAADAVFNYLPPETVSTIFATGHGYGTGEEPTNDPIRKCYEDAARASALQMAKERAKRRKAAGLPGALPLSAGPLDLTNCNRPELAAYCASWWESEDFWYNGHPAHHWALGNNGDHTKPNTNPEAAKRWFPPPQLDVLQDSSGHNSPAPGPNALTPENSQAYEGDYRLSLRQLILDDMAEQNGMVMQLLQSPDGIGTYPPDRLREAQLTETYEALRAQEEAALQVVAQTQTPGTVARISTEHTVTDPVGRATVGIITQQFTAGITHTPTGAEIQPGPGQGPRPPAGTVADQARQLQSGSGAPTGSPAAHGQAGVTDPAHAAAANSGFGTILLGGLAFAAMTLFGKK